MSCVGESCAVCGALYGDGMGWVVDRNDRGEIEHTCPECWKRAWINQSCDVCGKRTDPAGSGAGWITLATGYDTLDWEHYCPVCREVVFPDLFYIQHARADVEATRGRSARWSTCFYAYQDRSDAEASKEILERHDSRLIQVRPVGSTAVAHIRRRVRTAVRAFVGNPDPFAGMQNARGEEFETHGSVAVVYRVVSTTELREEGEDALQAAKDSALGPVWPHGRRIEEA